MLKSVPVEYCIIGHSERRDYFKETDEDENKKAKALIAGGIVPIFCCGESLETREAGEHVAFVTAQYEGWPRGRRDFLRRPARHRLRAHLGHQHRQDRHGR